MKNGSRASADAHEPCPYCKHDCAGQCQSDKDEEWETVFVNVRGVITFGDVAKVSER